MKDLTVEEAIREIEESGYECAAGPLVNNVAWLWLKERLRDAEEASDT